MPTLKIRYVGLDVHKRVVEVCIVDQAGRVVHRERFALCRSQLRAQQCRESRTPDRCGIGCGLLHECVERVSVVLG